MARRMFTALGGLIALGAFLLVLSVLRQSPPPGPTPTEPPGPPPAPTFLDQGWSPDQRERFYYTPQGSQLLPYAFLAALEQPEGEGLFLEDAYIAETGFLPAPAASPLNPDKLPVGFVKDPRPGGALGPSVGLTDRKSTRLNSSHRT